MVFPVYALGKQKGTLHAGSIPLIISELRVGAASDVLVTDNALLARVSSTCTNKCACDGIAPNQCGSASTDASTKTERFTHSVTSGKHNRRQCESNEFFMHFISPVFRDRRYPPPDTAVS